MNFLEWIKSLTNVLKTDDLQKYNGEDLKALIIAGSTGDALVAKPVVVKTVQNIVHLPTAIFWDKMERFLYGTFHSLEDQVKMASKFEFDTEDYSRFVKKQIRVCF